MFKLNHMKKYLIILLLLITGCTFFQETVDNTKYKIAKSFIETGVNIYPQFIDSTVTKIEFTLPSISINEEGVIEGLRDTIIVQDTTGRAELIAIVSDSACIGKITYKLKYVRDSIEIKLDCPTFVLDTTEWKRPYIKAEKKIEKLTKKTKKQRWFIIILITLLSLMIFLIYKIISKIK